MKPSAFPEAWTLILVMGTAAALLLGGVGMAAYNERIYHQQKARDAAVQAQILAGSVSASLAFDDPESAQEYVDALKANPELEEVGVYDIRNRLVASLTRPQAHSGAAFTVQVPVREAGVLLGRVRLKSSTEPAARRLVRFGGVAALVAMASIIVAVLGAAQAALRSANRELAARAAELQVQMDERAKAEEALRQSQKMEAIGQLTGGIAHDFNNLLQAVHGAFDLIRRKPTDAERVRRWADGGLHAAERGAKLTGQLLAFSRMQRLEMRALNVAELLSGIQDMLSRTLGPSISLSLDLDPVKASILADPTQLELAVLNLAINARDAMPEGGVLTIATRARTVTQDAELETGNYVEISVSDTGHGMTPDVLARAFDPFFTTKGVGKGTGLGLSQVYGIARQAGGGVHIDSAPGQGTTVTLALRRSITDAPSAAVAVSERRVGEGRGQAVLVIDDDPDVRGFLCASLDGLGYRVVEAADGPSGLAMLDRERPDLMLVDFAMPGMNGVEVATVARSRRSDLPIILASGFADPSVLKAAAVDSAQMLHKPFSLGELARAVEAALAPTASLI